MSAEIAGRVTIDGRIEPAEALCRCESPSAARRVDEARGLGRHDKRGAASAAAMRNARTAVIDPMAG